MPDSTLIYISLGSNIEPSRHLREASVELKLQLEQAVLSPIYQSPAVGMDGADFLNAVIGGRTRHSLSGLVSVLHDIETSHGRIRDSHKFSDRTLDLDLLLFGDHISQSNQTESESSINLPHPEITEQAYVIQPLADIAANLVHPDNGLTMQVLCEQMKKQNPDNFKALKRLEP